MKKSEAILKRVRARVSNDRAKTSLYLSKSLMERFKRKCGDVPASLVVEELVREFLLRGKK